MVYVFRTNVIFLVNNVIMLVELFLFKNLQYHIAKKLILTFSYNIQGYLVVTR